MTWDIGKPSRRLLVRNLPPGASNQSLHDFFSRYGEVIETFVPMDPQTRRSRAFGFAEFRLQADAQTVKDTVAEIEGTRVSIVYVESKRHEEEEMSRRGHGSLVSSASAPVSVPVHVPAMTGGRLQPPPVAPPPPVNPNTETYRYNTMAGEFVIDVSGRLTRRREYDDMDLDAAEAEAENRTTAGLGGGLLVGAAAGANSGELADEGDQTAGGVILLDPTSAGDGLDGLKPSEVIDFADI